MEPAENIASTAVMKSLRGDERTFRMRTAVYAARNAKSAEKKIRPGTLCVGYQLRITAPLLLLGLSTFPAWAARPFVTDDARLTNAHSCQLEVWTRIYPDSREFWALPACNPSGNLELTVGAGHARTDGENPTNDYVFQLKTLFRPLKPNDWGIGLAAGTVNHPEITPGPNLLGNIYAYVPLSVSFHDDSVIIHINGGWLRDKDSGTNKMTWGLGGEFRVMPRLLAIAEVFGDNQENPYFQVGARFAIVPDRIQVDATLGQQFSGPSDERWISFGLRLTPGPLF
jgi:hypothetical protein